MRCYIVMTGVCGQGGRIVGGRRILAMALLLAQEQMGGRDFHPIHNDADNCVGYWECGTTFVMVELVNVD